MKHAKASVISLSFAIGALALGTACRDVPVTDDPPPPVLRPKPLDQAHVAFLEGDLVLMAVKLRDVLMDDAADALAKENARALLEKAYDTNGGSIPTDWKLPQGFEGIAYKQIRAVEVDGLRRRIRIDGRVDDPTLVTGIQLSRRGEVLLDSTAKKGAYYATPDDDKMTYFSLESEDLDAFPEPGVFTLRLTTKDGKTKEGWFISDRLESSAVPVFSYPAAGDTIEGAHPTIRWEPFLSPEHARYERRTLSLWLNQRKEDGSYVSPWSSYTGNAGDRIEAKIGIKGEGGPEVELEKGDYVFGITYGEMRKLGPIALIRASRKSQGFHVTR